MSSARTELSAAAASATYARLPGFGDLVQVAVITPNVEQTVAALSAALGPGSFKVATLTSAMLFNTTYAGQPEDWSLQAALTWIGNVQLEVIQPTGGRNVYADYLQARAGRPGVEHIFLQQRGQSYDQAVQRFARAGFPMQQTGNLNAGGRLGWLPVPAMPAAIARRYGTRFGYTSTHDSLKVDIELAHFPFGMSQRLLLRAMIAEKWLPAGTGSHFETSPGDAILRSIDGICVLSENLSSLLDAYGKLTDRRPPVLSYSNDVLPGAGKLARIHLDTTTIDLVEPQTGALDTLLRKNGAGVQLVRGQAMSNAAPELLRSRGWKSETVGDVLYATHDSVPFALLVSRHES